MKDYINALSKLDYHRDLGDFTRGGKKCGTVSKSGTKAYINEVK